MEGKLIIFEGIDGSGTTTQASRLYSSLLGLKVPAHVTQEPSEGPVGSLIRQILHNRLITPGPTGIGAPSWPIMALLFAADRIDHLEAEIIPNINEGVHVISDRYVYSSLVYQSITSGADDNEDWIRTLNRFARRPDLVFFLDVDSAEAQRRRLARLEANELYEDVQLQVKIAEKYRQLMADLKDSATRVVIIDGNVGIDDVADRCLAETRALLNL